MSSRAFSLLQQWRISSSKPPRGRIRSISRLPGGLEVRTRSSLCSSQRLQSATTEAADRDPLRSHNRNGNSIMDEPLPKHKTTGAFQQLPMVMQSMDILSSAQRKARNVSPTKGIQNIAKRERNRGAKQLDALMKELAVPLRKYMETFPNKQYLHPYERSLIELTFGDGTYEEILGRVDALRKKVVSVGKQHASLCAQSTSKHEAEERLNVGLKKLEEVFQFGRTAVDDLLNVAKTLRAMPVVDPQTPTLCLVGAPNVGKSSLVRNLSTGKPEVCNYPFTTRGILMGHIILNYERFQVTDTPGLLTRHDDDRNNIERLTLAVLSYLPTAVLYVHDLSGECGTSPDDQFTTYKQIRERFKDHLWLDVVSKCDLLQESPDGTSAPDEIGRYKRFGPDGSIHVSVKSELGIDELKAKVRDLLLSQMARIGRWMTGKRRGKGGGDGKDRWRGEKEEGTGKGRMTGGGCGGGDGCVGSSGRCLRLRYVDDRARWDRSRGGSISLSFRPSHRSPISHLRSTAAGLFSRDASPRWFSSRRSYDLVALEGYGALHEQDFRASGSYGSRRLLPEGFSRDSGYARTTFHHDILERDIYPPPHVPGVWPQPRRSFDDEYALVRDSRRNVEPFHEMDNFGDHVKYHEDNFRDNYRNIERYHDTDSYHDYGYDRHARFGGRDHEGMSSDYEVRRHLSHESRENSRDRDYDYDWYSYDSDHERGKRDGGRRRRESRDREHEKRGLSRERDQSPYRRRERSRSHGRDDRSRSRSPRGRTRSRSHREDSYEDGRYERNDRRRDYDRDEKRHNDSSVAPSATIVVKGLSQKTTEDDLYQILAEWGPLRHIRVIKERNSGVSRGFAFIDFPDVDAARRMMDGIGDNGLVIDGRKLFFEYSSKPTGGAGAPSLGQESFAKSSHGHGRSITAPCDWICTMCGCLNFARRTSCFQCNEPRTEDAPPADVASTNPTPLGKRGSDLGPTHVLVVRGLDENADEEMLRYEFAKHAAIKDLRLVRDKFTHVSRGFAFVHFHSVEDATKALEATNGTTLEKNGQVLRVAYAKSIHGPGSGTPQSSSLAAAAIEAATFAQQYDAVGWTPKEYNPDQKQSTTGFEQNSKAEVQRGGSAPQSGFVWDEKSGYYYDAASGFYYDGNTGLYYDGNNGVWYSYDHQTQQYVPCNEQSNNKVAGDMANETSKGSDGTASKKVVISAAATTVKSNEKASLPDAVHAAATAALAAEKKEKEKLKEFKLASKSSLLANKKKMNNVLAMWKQRNHEGQAARVVLDDKESSGLLDDKPSNSYSASVALTTKSKLKSDSVKEAMGSSIYASSASRGTAQSISAETVDVDSQVKPRPVSNSLGGTIMGVIRGSGKGIIKSDTTFPVSASEGTTVSSTATASSIETAPALARSHATAPFKTDASALGSYGSSASGGRGKRRFSEAPALSNPRDQIPTTYRDRAAERRNLYGSSSAAGDDLSDVGLGDPNCDYPYRKDSLSVTGTMPFPPGVGGRSGGDIVSNTENYEVITADRAMTKAMWVTGCSAVWAGKKDWDLGRTVAASKSRASESCG
ncbi:unnamed protein product [Musa textilis]